MSCSASRIVKDAGSFRDPSGQVFHWQGRVFRGLSEDTWRVVREVEEHGLLAALAEEGLIVHTSLIAPGTELHRALSQHCPEYPHFLEHARVPFVSYPYEWSTAMIADAALLQLELQCRLIREGFALKDASVYNTQFLNGRPVFIDIPSIEHAPRNDVWTAYGQFCRHFLFPLLLVHYRHIDLRGYYLCSLEGQDIETVYQVLGATSSLRPALFFDVFLQRQLQHYGERRVGELRRRLVPAAAT
ncbi:hypothetical protein HQ590_10690, partial [bacterium]|nr:hypothetical protein [bacterium]